MKSIYQLIIPVFLLLFSPVLKTHAQIFGGLPASTPWQFRQQGSYRILYPRSLTASWAVPLQQKMSGLQDTTYNLGQKVKPIAIILQSQTTQSNGYVGMGPWRSEFFTTPFQNSFELGSLPWQDQLLLHESRHIHQYANFNQGFTKVFRLLAGDYGQDFFNSLIIPNWFWEGDAVWQETAISGQGRGRLPHFFGTTRAIAAAQKKYSWQQLRNGSYRDWTPDHYQLGYQLVAYGYHQFGADFWKKVTHDALYLKGTFYPFQKAIQKHAGIDYTTFQKQALQFFQKDSLSLHTETSRWAATKKHFQGDVHFPQWIDTTHLVYLKTSYDEVPTFIKKDMVSGKEIIIGKRSLALDEYFSARKNWIVYASLGFDKRWGWRDYGNITLLNINNGQSKEITQHGKYFAPDISEEGDLVIALFVDSTGNTNLHLLDSHSGEILNTLHADEGQTFTYPKFLDKDHIVLAVRQKNAQMGLMQWDLSTGKINWLLNPSNHVIAFPYPHHNNLYFSATYKGNDEVLLLSIGSGAIYRPIKMNEGNAGHYTIAGDENKIAWVDQTAVGKYLRTTAFTQTNWENVTASFTQDTLPTFGIKFSTNIVEKHSATTDTAHPYRKTEGLFRVHSWLPYASDPEYSYTLYSENLLNNMQGEAGLIYNRNEGSTKVYGGAAFAGWYPVLQISAGKTYDRKGATKYNNFSFDETESRIGWSIPLNLSGGKYYRSLRVGSNFTYAKANYAGSFKDSFDQHGYVYSNAFIRFTNQSLRSKKDIYPRYAQVLALDGYHANARLKGQQLLLNGQVFLPGLFKHHHVMLQAAMQGRDTLRQINYSNNFPFSRGYLARNGRWMQKIGINYHFPVAYPDAGIGNIVYLLRVRQNLFYDYTHLEDVYMGNTIRRTYRSVGTEIFFDTKWWNQEPFSIGIRYSYLLNGALQNRNAHQWELILPVLIR